MQTRLTRDDRPHLVDGARVYGAHYSNLRRERCQLMSSFGLRWARDSGRENKHAGDKSCGGGTESFITAETRARVLSDFLSSLRPTARAKRSDAKQRSADQRGVVREWGTDCRVAGVPFKNRSCQTTFGAECRALGGSELSLLSLLLKSISFFPIISQQNRSVFTLHGLLYFFPK